MPAAALQPLHRVWCHRCHSRPRQHRWARVAAAGSMQKPAPALHLGARAQCSIEGEAEHVLASRATVQLPGDRALCSAPACAAARGLGTLRYTAQHAKKLFHQWQYRKNRWTILRWSAQEL